MKPFSFAVDPTKLGAAAVGPHVVNPHLTFRELVTLTV